MAGELICTFNLRWKITHVGYNEYGLSSLREALTIAHPVRSTVVLRRYSASPMALPDSYFIVGDQKNILFEKHILDFIHAGKPVVLLDSSGEVAHHILQFIPEKRWRSVTYLKPDTRPFKLNVLKRTQPHHASYFLEAIKAPSDYKIATATLDHYFLYGIAALIDAGGHTLVDLTYFLTDETYRTKVLANVKDTYIKYVWHVFEQLKDKDQLAEVRSAFTKITALNLHPLIRNVLEQSTNRLRFNGVVVIDIPREELGTESASLLGCLILALIAIHKPQTTLFIHEAEYFPNIPTVQTFLTLNDYRPVPGIPVVTRTTVENAAKLEPLFPIPESGTFQRFFQIPPNEAYTLRGGTMLDFPIIPHAYFPRPRIRRKIIERCTIQYTGRDRGLRHTDE